MPFDRAHPLPSITLQNIQATGVGRASAGRLWAAVWCGLAATAALLASRGWWWLAFWPLCLAALGGYGIAAKEAQRLDLAHDPSNGRRAMLAATRGALLGVLAATAVAGLATLVGLLLRVDWLIDTIA
ncbi:MAG TPA: hypothetical protein VFJ74_12990 [Gemmatimonadaceae bacterium]|nr:hypothetical protein [Gemmatimonadaceae bacterium]